MLNTVWGYIETQTHGGVIQENVVKSGDLVYFYVNGDWYKGSKQGIVDTSDISVTGGQRTGGCIVSKDKYGYGSFECDLKLPAFSGICTSLWLFNYIESGIEGVPDRNLETDIEIHGTALGQNTGNLSRPVFTSWLTEDDMQSEYVDVYHLADGAFHRLRIDWHNDRIEYYIDGTLYLTQTTYVPDTEMYVYIGCWFPKDWCGDPAFETDCAVLRGFKYTAFDGETANTTEVVNNRQKGSWTAGIAEKHDLIGDADFRTEIEDTPAWTVYGTYTQVASSGKVTFSGTLSQTVTMDCLGSSYTLMLAANGGTVTVTYIGADGTELGSVTGAATNGLTFTTAAATTALRIDITGDDTTITGATLRLA